MPDYEFHVTVQPYIDRVLLYDGAHGTSDTNDIAMGARIGEMSSVTLDESAGTDIGTGKIFNGTIPERYLVNGRTFVMRLLSNEGVLNLPAKDVLSIPITDIRTDSGISVHGEQHNFIVVNDIPGEAEVCLVSFPPRFVRLMGVPQEIELARKARGALKTEWKAKNADLLARGVDPIAQNFIAPVVLTPSPEPGTMTVLENIAEEIVSIKLYGVDICRPFCVS